NLDMKSPMRPRLLPPAHALNVRQGTPRLYYVSLEHSIPDSTLFSFALRERSRDPSAASRAAKGAVPSGKDRRRLSRLSLFFHRDLRSRLHHFARDAHLLTGGQRAFDLREPRVHRDDGPCLGTVARREPPQRLALFDDDKGVRGGILLLRRHRH